MPDDEEIENQPDESANGDDPKRIDRLKKKGALRQLRTYLTRGNLEGRARRVDAQRFRRPR